MSKQSYNLFVNENNTGKEMCFMTLIEALYEQYGTNEPILLSEISFEDYSRPWIMKQLQMLCEDGRLCKYEKGVYYIPTKTIFGKSILNPRKVIERKYISDSNRIMGYYSGIIFQNQLKITTQMPNVIEIYTNNEKSKVREVTIGNQRVVLRRARTEINSENAPVLSFLELMNDITPASLDEEKRKRIIEYIYANNITRKDILDYANVFPDKVMRNLIESEVIFFVV